MAYKNEPQPTIHETHFIDIETVRSTRYILESELYKLFEKRFQSEYDAGLSWQEIYERRAGLFAEFGKVVCISIGKLQGEKLYIKTLCGKNEVDLLNQFKEILENPKLPAVNICAHNGKEFDFPFLFRRYVINKIPVPKILDRTGKKPWDGGHEDTMEMWGGGQWKYYASLDLIAQVFGIPSPKTEMSGADVGNVYYDMFDVENDELPFDKEEKAIKKIASYCAGDIPPMVDIYARIKNVPSYSEIAYL